MHLHLYPLAFALSLGTTKNCQVLSSTSSPLVIYMHGEDPSESSFLQA